VIYRISGLVYTYPTAAGKKVLDGVSLTVAAGEVLTLLGRNGAGKSTLLSCMLGLLRPQAGELLLTGRSIGAMSAREIAATVGYVPQFHLPGFDYTVLDFVVMGCASRIGFFSRPGRREREDAEAALEELHISHLRDRPYTRISGGERQQAIIARTIVSRPQALLFDEPTAHLDFGNQMRVLRCIKALAAKGYAVVMTTHNPDHALLLGGRAALLDGCGRLGSGRTEEIVTQRMLSDMYGADIRLEHVASIGRKVAVYPSL
jgi:iron complex transport system ATP-binding protein